MEQETMRFGTIVLGLLMLTVLVASAHAATLTLISPNGHADWYTGETHAITWTQSGLSGTNIKIDLMVGTDTLYFARTIASSVPATGGTYSWTIPCSISTGDHYRVKITSLSFPSVTDFSAGREFITSSGTCGVASIKGISPSSRTRPSTGTVYVSGAGFQPSAQVWVRHTGGTTYQVLSEVTTSTSQIRGTLTLPSTAPLGSYAVYVKNPGKTAVARANALMVTSGIAVVNGISPSSRTRPKTGTVSGTEYVSGSGFQPSAQVWVKHTGGTTYHLMGEVTTSTSQIRGTLTIPSSAPLGYYTLYVQNPGKASVSKANAFRVTAPLVVPSVSSISPSSAFRGRRITALVYGGRFQPGAQVKLVGGGTTISASGETTIGSAQIRCTLVVPTTATRGYYTLYVQNPGGTWIGRSSAFRVL